MNFNATSQTVVNDGIVVGDINLSGENDMVHNGGLVNGAIRLGDGADRFTETIYAYAVGGAQGGAGGDRFDLLTGRGASAPVFDGGEGSDLVSFSTATGAIRIDLSMARALDGAQTISLLSIENAAGSAFGDEVAGSDIANRLEGLGGGDLLQGRGGDDLITGGGGADQLFGGDGNDALDGGSENDRLEGGLGNDMLTGGKGDDILIGGLGTDRTAYSGFVRQYGRVGVGGSIRITGDASEGSDLLTGVEEVAFRDGKIISDPDSAGAKVIRLYDTVLGRAPDAGGLDFYAERLESGGVTLVAVAGDVAGSPEFQQATGGLNNAQFVDYVYRNALGRAPDADGSTYYTQQLNNGLSRGAFVVDLSESAEHRALTADRVAQGYFDTDDNYQAIALLYDSFMGRLPDAGGLSFYAERLKQGAMTLGQVTADFAGSVEFTSATQGLSNAQLVDYVYRNTLDRSPDAGGQAFYTARLDQGMTRANFVQEVAFSQEHYNLLSPFIVDGIQLG